MPSGKHTSHALQALHASRAFKHLYKEKGIIHYLHFLSVLVYAPSHYKLSMYIMLGSLTKLFFIYFSLFDRRSPISIAAAAIYMISQLSDDKKPLKGKNKKECSGFLGKGSLNNISFRDLLVLNRSTLYINIPCVAFLVVSSKNIVICIDMSCVTLCYFCIDKNYPLYMYANIKK